MLFRSAQQRRFKVSGQSDPQTDIFIHVFIIVLINTRSLKWWKTPSPLLFWCHMWMSLTRQWETNVVVTSRLRLIRTPYVRQGLQIWSQSRSDWSKMGQNHFVCYNFILTSFREDIISVRMFVSIFIIFYGWKNVVYIRMQKNVLNVINCIFYQINLSNCSRFHFSLNLPIFWRWTSFSPN